MRAGRPLREMHDVAGLELAFALGGPQRGTPAQDEDQLVGAVMEVVRHLRLPGLELPDAHAETMSGRNQALDVRTPALGRREGIVPLVRQDIGDVAHAASFGSGSRSWMSQRRSPVCEPVRAWAVIFLRSGYSATSGETRIPAT